MVVMSVPDWRFAHPDTGLLMAIKLQAIPESPLAPVKLGQIYSQLHGARDAAGPGQPIPQRPAGDRPDFAFGASGQCEEAIKFRLPAKVAPGRYSLMVLTAGEPK